MEGQVVVVVKGQAPSSLPVPITLNLLPQAIVVGFVFLSEKESLSQGQTHVE